MSERLWIERERTAKLVHPRRSADAMLENFIEVLRDVEALHAATHLLSFVGRFEFTSSSAGSNSRTFRCAYYVESL